MSLDVLDTDVMSHIFKYCQLSEILILKTTWRVCNEAFVDWDRYLNIFTDITFPVLNLPTSTASEKQNVVLKLCQLCMKQMNGRNKKESFDKVHVLRLGYRMLCGANAFRTMTHVILFQGNGSSNVHDQTSAEFLCTVSERMSKMSEILRRMGWGQISPEFDLALVKHYAHKALFPSKPNNVAGIVWKEPKSMIPSQFSQFLLNAHSSFEEPTFMFDQNEIIGRFYIIHYGGLALGVFSSHQPLLYSLVEMRVSYPEGKINRWVVVKSVDCPRNENSKRHGGCVVM